jgi:hypothetical protein
MNYGEELVYWYLRLNGFFPINDFVVHKSSSITYTSDCDVLAVRPKHVYEEVGGKPEDWDPHLADELGFADHFVGLVCEVKTGAYEDDKLFRSEHIGYSIARLGLWPLGDIPGITAGLAYKPCVGMNGMLVGKLLVTDDDNKNGPFLFRSVNQIEDFINDRVERYTSRKYKDRMFFHSDMFQQMIHQVHRRREVRQGLQ